MNYLVLVRHGQSEWNLENKFTGWVDVDLTEQGEEEAHNAGKALKEKNIKFDIAYTSLLKRANITLRYILAELGQGDLKTIKNEALNERHYGDLQGKNKAETAEKYGEEQVKIWRRSYDIAPPSGESLKDTAERCLPYYTANIEKDLQAGKNVIVGAHGNSLRAIVKHILDMTPEEILAFEIPTANPLIFEYRDGSLKFEGFIF